MKKLFKVFVALVLVLSVVSLASCKCNKDKGDEPKEVAAKGYGLVHKDYVGIADIKVKEGKVTALTFEEVYLPTHWAGVVSTEGVSEDLYLTYTNSKNKEVVVAKYVVVDGKLFTGKVNGTDVEYSAEGIANLKAWVQESEENAKWYAEALLAGKAEATDASKVKVSFQITADKEGGFKKSTTGYWSGDNYPLGWKGNMEALSKALVGTSMGFADADIVKDGTWKIGDVTSTATLVDAKDYIAVAQRAYNAATK